MDRRLLVMKNKIRRIISIFICLVIFFCTSVISDSDFVNSLKLVASAIGENYYMINGKTVNCDSVADPGNGKNEEYVKSLYKYVWGIEYTDDFASSDNILKNIEYNDRTLNEENLKAFVKRIQPGTVLKVENISSDEISSNNGYSFFIVSYDDNGFTVFERTNETKESYYSWNSFCMIYKYSTIRFLKWPNSYFVSSVSNGEKDFKKPVRALYYDPVEILNGDDVRWIQKKLVEAGYSVSVDGYYGKKAETAVKLFQRDFSLTVTGIVDSLTADMLEKPVKKPNKINLIVDTTSCDEDLSIGDILTVTWDKVDYAEGYHIFIYNNKGKLVDELDNVSTNKASFVLSASGTYTVKGYAQNEVFVGDMSTMTQKVKVHNSYTVKFVDYDGTLLNKQAVVYGKDAQVPPSPKREGYSFKGWDTNFNNVKSSLTVTAQYIQKSYTVTFKDGNGKVIGKPQTVLYGEAASEPDSNSIPGFVSWDKDFSFISSSLTVSAVVENSTQLPFSVTDTSAKREAENGGYTVNFKVTNNDEIKRIARAVIALKTTTGKFLTLTESSAFTLTAAGEKIMKVVVPYSKAATVVEIYIVEDYKTLIPLSKVAKITNISTEDNYTDWLPDDEAPQLYYSTTDYRDEYRYKTRTTTVKGFNTYTGWTLDKVTVNHFNESGWSGYTRTPVSRKSETLLDGKSYVTMDVECKNQTYTSGYNLECWVTQSAYSPYYRHYWNYNHGPERKSYGQWYHYKWVSVDYFNGMGWVDIGARYSGVPSNNWNYGGYNKAGVAGRTDNDGYIYFNTSYTTDSYILYRTKYYYPVYDYHFHKDSSWSEWSTTKITKGTVVDANNTIQEVEKRQTRRYEVNDPTETNTGKTRTIAGNVGKNLAGKQATLFIYKIGEASDYTNEYIGQTAINDDGSYKFNFKLREEPTVETGDFTVTLGIEGTNNVICLESIKAPLAQYTVYIKDYDGRIISTQKVNKGESAKLPTNNPSRPGYTFAGWNYSNASIYEDTDIQALYVQDEYTVVFIDWANEKYVMQTGYHYGDSLIAPDLNYLVEVDMLDENGNPIHNTDGSTAKEYISSSNEAYLAKGWEGVTEGMTVTRNMVITAEYEEKTFKVNFYDYDKNIIDTQTVRYGEAAEAPTLSSDNEHLFISWDSYDFSCVTSSLDVQPIYSYTETVATPTANLESGSYDSGQTLTLSCATENSIIHYSVNDGDDTVYTEPIAINETAKISFYAVANNCNTSETKDAYYAINTSQNMDSWQYVVKVYNDDNMVDLFMIPAGQSLEEANWKQESYISDYSSENVSYLAYHREMYVYHHILDKNKPDLYHKIIISNPLIANKTINGTTYYGNYPCPTCNEENAWVFDESYVEPVYLMKTVKIPIYSTRKVRENRTDKYIGDEQTLEGFYLDSGFSKELTTDTPINSDAKLYIKTGKKQYNVKFCKDDGTVISEQTVSYLDKAVAPESVTVEAGKVFLGWNTDDYKCVTKDLIVTAIIKASSDIANIALDKTKLTTISGMSYQLNAKVTPTEYQDNTIVWKSNNTSVATVSTNGLIKAVSPGTATITATLVGDYIRTAQCVVTVKSNNAEDITLVGDSTLKIENQKLLGVKPGKNSVSEIFAEIDAYSLEAYSSEGKKLSGENLMETGSTINLIDENGKILDSVTVILMGDVNGDGLVNIKDASIISRAQVGKGSILGDAYLAADIDSDGNVLQKDASIILSYIEGKKTIFS